MATQEEAVELLDLMTQVYDAVEREAYARKAALVAMKYRGTWQGLARAMSRNPKLRLELSSRYSYTTGDAVYIKVPIELGFDFEHHRPLCGKRDEIFVQRCKACAVHEEIFITIIHEIAHIVQGTFNQMSEDGKVRAIQQGVNAECRGKPDGSRAVKIRKRIESLPEEIGNQYLPVASMISPFLPLIVNAVEDSRVNLATERTRKGTRLMFHASHTQILQRGIRVTDEKVVFLKDSIPNMQAITDVFYKTSGLDDTQWLDPEIAERLDDPALNGLCEQASKLTNVGATYTLSVSIHERLRELGFCLTPDDENDEEQPQPQSGSGGESSDGSSSSQAPPDSSKSSSPNGNGGDTTKPDTDPSGDDKGNGSQPKSADSEDDTDGEDGDDSQDDGGNDSEPDGSDQGEGSGSGGDAEADNGESDKSSPGGQPSSGSDSGDPADSQPQSDAGSSPGHPQGSAQPSSGTGSPGGASSSGDYLKPGDYYSPEQYEKDGTPEAVKELMEVLSGHDKFTEATPEQVRAETDGDEYDRAAATQDQSEEVQETNNLMDKALNQVVHFDKFSGELSGLHLWHYGDPEGEYIGAWPSDGYSYDRIDPAADTPEGILSPAVMKLRLAFTDNRKGRKEVHLKKGRIDPKGLPRVAFGEVDVFRKKIHPAKKDYFVVVGFDVSGSTSGPKIKLIKGAVKAQLNLLDRVGVGSAAYAHSSGGDYVDICEIKAPGQPWASKAKEALDKIGSFGYNLDGHSLEFYRKVAQSQPQTDKVVLFYTDGALNNIGEEYEVFTENVKIMRQLGITCVGIEVACNSGMSEQLGMDTVRIDSSHDIAKVVKELEKRISHR